jgi:hypothetical protein
LLAICITSVEKCLFRSLPIKKFGLLEFLWSFVSSLYILDIKSVRSAVGKYFFPFCRLFLLLNRSFLVYFLYFWGPIQKIIAYINVMEVFFLAVN